MPSFVRITFVILIAVLLSVAINQSIEQVNRIASCQRTEGLVVGSEVAEDVFSMPEQMIAIRTFGDVSPLAVELYTSAAEYIDVRRTEVLTRKGFLAFYSIDFNRWNDKYFLIPTAALGISDCTADLALVNRTTRKIERLYRGKTRFCDANESAMELNGKETILVPIDLIAKVDRNFVFNGKIADSVCGFTTGEIVDYERRAVDFFADRFNELKFFNTDGGKTITAKNEH